MQLPLKLALQVIIALEHWTAAQVMTLLMSPLSSVSSTRSSLVGLSTSSPSSPLLPFDAQVEPRKHVYNAAALDPDPGATPDIIVAMKSVMQLPLKSALQVIIALEHWTAAQVMTLVMSPLSSVSSTRSSLVGLSTSSPSSPLLPFDAQVEPRKHVYNAAALDPDPGAAPEIIVAMKSVMQLPLKSALQVTIALEH
jgi:hypothetical protein